MLVEYSKRCSWADHLGWCSWALTAIPEDIKWHFTEVPQESALRSVRPCASDCCNGAIASVDHDMSIEIHHTILISSYFGISQLFSGPGPGLEGCHGQPMHINISSFYVLDADQGLAVAHTVSPFNRSEDRR